MSKYDKETKFYWLQLKEDFFEDDAIEWLEEQQPNGRDYAYFYLKLCLKSLKSNGILIREVGNILIPYDNQKLAEITKMDFDTVTIAMELLKKIGLVQVLDNGEIYMTQLENLIGSVSKGALKKQQQRLISRQTADKCPPKIELKDKDKVKDKDITKDNLELYEQNFGTLSPTIYEMLLDLENAYTPKYVTEAMKRAIMSNKKSLSYVNGILKKWKNKTWDEIIQEEDKKENGNVPSWFNQNWDSKKEIEEVEEELPKEPELEDYFDIFN